jgi:hypothetical protein
VEAHTPSATGRPSLTRRLSTETKSAFKSTEFWVYIGLLIALLIAGTVDNSEGSQFGADDVWLYATLLTIGYLISRGLAKSGSRDPYWDEPGSGDGGPITERVKAAAQVLKDGEDANSDSNAGTTGFRR